MKKGFKFLFTVKSVCNGRIVSRNFMDIYKVHQEFLFRKNCDLSCTQSVIFANFKNEVVRVYGLPIFD